MWLVLLFGAIIVEWVNYKVFWSKNKPTTHYSQNDHTYHQNDYQPDRSYHSTSNNNSYNTSSQDRSSHGKSYDTTLPKGRSYGSNTSMKRVALIKVVDMKRSDMIVMEEG